MTLQLPWFNVGGTFYVVDTDYTSYSIPYSCSVSLGFWKSEQFWVLMRQPHAISSSGWKALNTKVMGIINRKFQTNEEENKRFIDTEEFLETPIQGNKFCNYSKQAEWAAATEDLFRLPPK